MPRLVGKILALLSPALAVGVVCFMLFATGYSYLSMRGRAGPPEGNPDVAASESGWVSAYERWLHDYNHQEHWAHLGRDDGRRSPMEVLGWLSEVRYRPEDLERAFFSSRFTRVLDGLGYARFRHWRLYGEEGLAKKETALWLQEESLTLEYRGQPLSRYDVAFEGGTEELRAVTRPTLFETGYVLSQGRLFTLGVLGEDGWLKALKLDGYAPRKPSRPQALQGVLFSHGEEAL